MNVTPLLFLALASSLFDSTVERAFVLFENSELVGAAAALDQAHSIDPYLFAANNLHYLRGHIAEKQSDWIRARSEFSRIGRENPLHSLVTWHLFRALIHLQEETEAERLFDAIPGDFPSTWKIQLAREASERLALKIYQNVPTREARLQRSILLRDDAGLWSLVRERKVDDVALEAANLLAEHQPTGRDLLDLAGVFYRQREFDKAMTLYEKLRDIPELSGEAHFQLGRTHFQKQDYTAALDAFRITVEKFQDTDWERESKYQIANCYWRLDDYTNAEKAYLDFLRKYASGPDFEQAVRNLVDVYRTTGEKEKALAWLEKALKGRLTIANRQVFLFSKAKILYSQRRYRAALAIFRQLGSMRLRSAPGGTTSEEVRYFEGLCLEKMDRAAEAKAVWRRLAADPFTYYGRKAALRVGAFPRVIQDRAGASHGVAIRPIRTAPEPTTDAVAELVFLRLWDEAFMLAERKLSGQDSYRALAELAHLAGQFHREIFYADRVLHTGGNRQTSDALLNLLYPAGFDAVIRKAIKTYQVDPRWILAIIWRESRFNPRARSNAAARGLMQFIPETGRSVGRAIGLADLTTDQLYDPDISIRLGVHHWGSLMDQLQVSELALAAYNAGIENVERWKRKLPDADLELFVAEIGFEQTKQYVLQVSMIRSIYEYLGR